jgi:hypothetical protein
MIRHVSNLISLLAAAVITIACGNEPPSEKTALRRCQSLARDEMPEVAGNPRYRTQKSVIEQVKAGPDDFEFTVKGEYFFKALENGDSEMRFTCSIGKSLEDEEWTTLAFNSICVGGCG